MDILGSCDPLRGFNSTTARQTFARPQSYAERMHNLQLAQEKRTSWWECTSPDGKTHRIWNLSAFCRKHRLTQSKMSQVASGDRHRHKGWDCRKIA
jgi:hypothetical protein